MTTAQEVLQHYLETCKRRGGRIILLVLVFVGLGVGATLLMEKEYKATSRVIVTQNLGASGNIYTSRRAANAATETLVKVAYSDQFYNRFTKGNNKIKKFFPDTLEKRRRAFQNDVLIRTPEDGIISITTFNPDRGLALKENKAALEALRTMSDEYFSKEDGVRVHTINSPSLHEGVGRPNIWMNMAAAGLFGLVMAALHLMFVTRRRMARMQGYDEEFVPAHYQQSF